MERDQSSQEIVPVFEVGPTEIDLTHGQEPNGYSVLEENYGDDPLKLALNTAVAIDVLIDKTFCSMDDGEEVTVMDIEAQTFFDGVIDALIAGDKADPTTGEDVNRGMSHLMQRFSIYLGCSGEFLKERLTLLKSNKNSYFVDYESSSEATRAEAKEHIADDLHLLRRATRQYIHDSLEKVPVKDAEAEIDTIEQALFEEFIGPILMQDRSDAVLEVTETIPEIIPPELMEVFESKAQSSLGVLGIRFADV